MHSRKNLLDWETRNYSPLRSAGGLHGTNEDPEATVEIVESEALCSFKVKRFRAIPGKARGVKLEQHQFKNLSSDLG